MKRPKQIPNIISFAYWFVFKSPQRAWGIRSLWQDFMGLCIFGLARFNPMIGPKPVSICIGIKNRSSLLVKHLIGSLNQSPYKKWIELSILDCGSDDVENLEHLIRTHWNGDLVFRQEKRDFARAYAFNRAVEQCHHEIIFLCDADFSVPWHLPVLTHRMTLGKAIWFPIVFYLYKHCPDFYHPNHGEWMQWGGKGLVACKKSDFKQIGGLNESFVTWGQEDDEFWERCYKNGNWIVRNRERGLLHHWHPSFNPKYQELEKWADETFLKTNSR